MKKIPHDVGEPFDERANEDGYFALKEHELIEEMKNEHRQAEAARREALMRACPKCPGKLAKHRITGFVIERCDTCEGIWLKKGELDEVLRRRAGGRLGAFIERCLGKV